MVASLGRPTRTQGLAKIHVPLQPAANRLLLSQRFYYAKQAPKGRFMIVHRARALPGPPCAAAAARPETASAERARGRRCRGLDHRPQGPASRAGVAAADARREPGLKMATRMSPGTVARCTPLSTGPAGTMMYVLWGPICLSVQLAIGSRDPLGGSLLQIHSLHRPSALTHSESPAHPTCPSSRLRSS